MSETLIQRINREDAECTRLRIEIEALKNLFVEVKPAVNNLKPTEATT
jgi:hypothetical protein